MKKFIFALILSVICSGLQAQTLIVLTKNDVNLRSTPSTTGSVVSKGKKGIIMKTSGSKNGWYQAINPQNDESVWVASSVCTPVQEYFGENPAFNLVMLPGTEYGYENVSSQAGGEVTTCWIFSSNNPGFWDEAKPGSAITATNTTNMVSSNGRMHTIETYYKGVYQPTVLILTEISADGGETYANLDSPIYIYPTVIDNESGIYIDGVRYDDQNAM